MSHSFKFDWPRYTSKQEHKYCDLKLDYTILRRHTHMFPGITEAVVNSCLNRTYVQGTFLGGVKQCKKIRKYLEVTCL